MLDSDRMSADPVGNIERFPLPPAHGIPGLTQGAYGDAGNLELVVPGIDGLWVYWFNADPVDRRHGAVRGHWSGGLNIARGMRFSAANITQMSAGPLFLEVLALQMGGQVRRMYWTPSDGFVDAGVIATGAKAVTPVIQGTDHARFSSTQTDGTVSIFSAPISKYPKLMWIPLQDRDAAGLPDSPTKTAASAIPASDAAATASTSLDGGRIDAVLRRGRLLWHSHSRDGDDWSEQVLIESVVWRRPGDGPVHRVG
jgi:hypothetical protein